MVWVGEKKYDINKWNVKLCVIVVREFRRLRGKGVSY